VNRDASSSERIHYQAQSTRAVCQSVCVSVTVVVSVCLSDCVSVTPVLVSGEVDSELSGSETTHHHVQSTPAERRAVHRRSDIPPRQTVLRAPCEPARSRTTWRPV